MNLGEFRLVLSSVISLDNTAGSAEQGLIDRAVNRGVIDVLRKTRCFVSLAWLALQDGIWEYNVPNAILEIVSCSITTGQGEDESPPLLRRTSDQITLMRKNTSAQNGTPRYYSVEGSNLILLHPVPSSTQDLHILFVPRPQPLVSSSDDPATYAQGGVPEDYHDAIEMYALWRLADYDDDGSSQMGERYRGIYQQRYREIRREIERMGTSKLSPFQIPNLRP